MDKKRKFHRFLLLWSGELVSAIGSGLTSFGLGGLYLPPDGQRGGYGAGEPAGVSAHPAAQRSGGGAGGPLGPAAAYDGGRRLLRPWNGLRGAACRHGADSLSNQSSPAVGERRTLSTHRALAFRLVRFPRCQNMKKSPTQMRQGYFSW